MKMRKGPLRVENQEEELVGAVGNHIHPGNAQPMVSNAITARSTITVA
jgi:hypothetical protein